MKLIIPQTRNSLRKVFMDKDFAQGTKVIPKECPTFTKVDKEHPLIIPQKKKTNQ